MPRLKLENVKPGMILAEDVTKDGRNILLNTGQVMDQRLIDMLTKREITEILVEEPSPLGTREGKAAPVAPQAKTGETLPVIRAIITNDQMSAMISVSPQAPDDLPLTEDMIKKALVDKGVAFGFLEAEISNIVRRFNKIKQRIDNIQVAKGKLATPGKQGEVEIVVPHISTREDYQRLSSAMYAADIKGIIKEDFRVDGGTIIAKRLDAQPSQPGTDVCGETVEIDELTRVPANVGSNVESIKDDTRFQATATGVACCIEGIVSVYEISFDGRAEIAIADDKMEASVTIHPAAELGSPVTEEGVRELLKEKGVVAGILEDEIRGAVQDAKAGKVVENTVVAKGSSPAPGDDGSVEFLFDATGKVKPQTKEDGTVDYKSISLVESVEQGQELARLIPPTEGSPGSNILGEQTPSVAGNPAQLPMGPNTAPKPDDETVLISTASGNVRHNGKLIEVQEGFSVKGDVDFSTGNIQYAKSVSILADVKSGFTVDAGGDIEVAGTVEDASLKAEGNVLVKCGFIGSGKGVIQAKGNVSVGFIRNQEIRSRQDITIAREAIGSKLSARNSIEAMGKPFSIAGGHISARNEIKAYAIGNENGVRTEVEVGRDFTLVEEQAKTEEKIKELSGSRQKVMENLQKLRHIKQLRKNLQPKEEFLLKKLEAMEEKINTQLASLEKRKQMIAQKLLEVGRARIAVEHAVYPGTVIKIGERHLVVTKEIIGPKSIMYVKGEIKAV